MPTTEYQQKSDPQGDRCGAVWIPPSASLASRRPALRSRGSFRGALVNPKTNREIVFESTLERDLAYILLASPCVTAVQDQPEAVEYIDSEGVTRKHTFDFLIRKTDGSRTAFAVKPAAKVASSGTADVISAIRSQCPRGFADSFEIRTGDHITRNRAYNARIVAKGIRMRNAEDVAAVNAVASTLCGSVKISTLLAASRNDGYGFMAVLCLISDGVLEHVGTDRISHDSIIRIVHIVTRTH